MATVKKQPVAALLQKPAKAAPPPAPKGTPASRKAEALRTLSTSVSPTVKCSKASKPTSSAKTAAKPTAAVKTGSQKPYAAKPIALAPQPSKSGKPPSTLRPTAAAAGAKDRTTKPPTSWSFSRYMDWSTCPRKFKLKHLDKINEPPNAAMARGIAVHNMAEAYVKGTLAKLPDELKSFKDEFTKLRAMYKSKKLPMIVEDNWAFDVNWDETQWNNWAECWVRIKLDCAHYAERNVMFVTDYKTGKMSDFKNAEYMMQMELYALAALLMSSVEDVTIKPRLLYTDSGQTYPPAGQEVSYTRADLPELMGTWNKRVKPMMTATHFPPRANSTCKWCWYGQSKKAEAGGPGLCEY